MEWLAFAVILLLIYLVNAFFESLSNKKKEKETIRQNTERKNYILKIKSEINYYNAEKFISFVKTNQTCLSDFLEVKDYKGYGESYKKTYETSKYLVTESFSDDDYNTVIKVVDKSSNQVLTYI